MTKNSRVRNQRLHANKIDLITRYNYIDNVYIRGCRGGGLSYETARIKRVKYADFISSQRSSVSVFQGGNFIWPNLHRTNRSTRRGLFLSMKHFYRLLLVLFSLPPCILPPPLIAKSFAKPSFYDH